MVQVYPGSQHPRAAQRDARGALKLGRPGSGQLSSEALYPQHWRSYGDHH